MVDFPSSLGSGALDWTTCSEEMVEEGGDVGTWEGVDVGTMDGPDVDVGDGVELIVQTIDDTIVDVAIVYGTPIPAVVDAMGDW